MEAQYIYIGLAALFGVFMAWGIGANDVANAMAPSVGSRALTIKQAIVLQPCVFRQGEDDEARAISCRDGSGRIVRISGLLGDFPGTDKAGFC